MVAGLASADCRPVSLLKTTRLAGPGQRGCAIGLYVVKVFAMQTSLDHLPAAKQRELERVVQILFEEFADATAIATSEWKKQARILKVILYGSYARGGWVDEP